MTSSSETQLSLELPSGLSPSDAFDRDIARRSLDDLFTNTRQYRTSKSYKELMDFITRFKFYSPFNAMLVHIQMPGAQFVAPPHRWKKEYRRCIKAGARPLVILQPRGPVMFVLDVSDTEPCGGVPDLLPFEVLHPFEVRRGKLPNNELGLTIRNAVRDGIDVAEQQGGSQSAGQIRKVETSGRTLSFQTAIRPEAKFATVPIRYEILMNAKHSHETKYATLVHELAHLYCGHLGTPNTTWWPDRTGLPKATREYEAESVCYLVCCRLGMDNPSEAYLSDYLTNNTDVPPVSLDCVMKAAGVIEQMGRESMALRRNS